MWINHRIIRAVPTNRLSASGCRPTSTILPTLISNRDSSVSSAGGGTLSVSVLVHILRIVDKDRKLCWHLKAWLKSDCTSIVIAMTRASVCMSRSWSQISAIYLERTRTSTSLRRCLSCDAACSSTQLVFLLLLNSHLSPLKRGGFVFGGGGEKKGFKSATAESVDSSRS